jgi:excinuclease UvrABC ATPase subunit
MSFIENCYLLNSPYPMRVWTVEGVGGSGRSQLTQAILLAVLTNREKIYKSILQRILLPCVRIRTTIDKTNNLDQYL